ncbi:synaptopodin [Brienomyrus brachyistius]|uniref:synaptopodin n=1 Tax=Brienomyrus brachyistius TaxID=42636 RepID=UPI0020B1B8A8|nr:synaptopodin [Brienomyrus brachyistius]XP_048885058.1 synaptopodin [Brienomyrus brachyistius]XP_048885060.1 synaptopodin [Brienomyrus brachyistius]
MHQQVERQVTWTGLNSFASLDKERRDRKIANGNPALGPSTDLPGRKTNLSRSASLSEKELKEARDRSQIIAAQLTIPSNASSRGVQLFNKRRTRVNAFTLVSFGKGVGQEASGDDKNRPPKNTLTWEDRLSEGKEKEFNGRNSDSQLSRSSSVLIQKDSKSVLDQGEPIPKMDNSAVREEDRHFLPVKENDAEFLSDIAEKVNEELDYSNCSNKSVQSSKGKGEVAVTTAATDSFILPGEIPNGSHGDQNTENGSPSLMKQTTAIVNRTARPFGSPNVLRSPETRSPVMVSPQHTLPTFNKPLPQAFSPPPPAFSPSPVSPPACSAPPEFFSPPPVSRIVSPSPGLAQYAPAVTPRPHYNPQLISERKQQVPIRTGILDEGKTRRATRKAMFTFQEKPKLDPNPELLSLVQGVDEKKKLRSQFEHMQEEELLELGAEASNFLAKDTSCIEEVKVPEWSSCLKRSETRVRLVPKAEQGLTNASGKGAQLFARRQSRMEKYVVGTPSGIEGYVRSPSPTASLPPSWTFPSSMPGRVRAMASSSKINIQPPKMVKTAPVVVAKPTPAAESPVLENGCTKTEMKLYKHQPYQLDSSLFILNPTKDPMSSLPKAAPPPKPVVSEKVYMRQTSLPMNSTPISPHLSSPVPFRSPKSPSTHVPQSRVNGMGSADARPNYEASPRPEVGHQRASPISPLSPQRVASQRPGIQAPRPTFSARKAGIEPQTRGEALSSPSTPTTLHSRQSRSPDGPASGVKVHPASCLQAPSPLPPTWDERSQSPSVSQDDKANRRLLAKNIINAAKRKNSPSPGALGGRGMSVSPGFLPPHGQRPFSPFQSRSPTFISPPPTPTRSMHSPVCLYTTRSLTDSDASVDSEDLGLRSPGTRSYNTSPRGWGGSLRLKRGNFPADL